MEETKTKKERQITRLSDYQYLVLVSAAGNWGEGERVVGVLLCMCVWMELYFLRATRVQLAFTLNQSVIKEVESRGEYYLGYYRPMRAKESRLLEQSAE